MTRSLLRLIGIAVFGISIWTLNVLHVNLGLGDPGHEAGPDRDGVETPDSGGKPWAYLGILRGMVESADLPACAYTESYRVELEKPIVGTFIERWQARHDLLAAARDSFHIPQHFADVPESSTVVLRRYDDRGDRVLLELAHRRDREEGEHASGRRCSPATHTEQDRPQLIVGLSCDTIRRRLSETIAATTAHRTAGRFWTRYRYTLDYQNLEIDFRETLCSSKELGTL